jgi:membrane protein YdbS with pleckstrin-like domain
MNSKNKDECEEIFQSIRIKFNKFWGYIKKYPLTILSILMILQLLYFQLNLENINFQNILIALATIFATILALVFTLSLIPIQNAASMWTFSILKIYREDKTNYNK